MKILGIAFVIIMGYGFGCIQTAYLIGRLAGKIDIRNHGSNNAGASNVTVVLGWKYGVLTAVVDILKAVIPIVIVKTLYPGGIVLTFLCGAMVILGHIFPANLGFKGGKGAASIIGMFLAVDFRICIIIAVILILATILLDYIALGSIAMFTAVPILTYAFGYSGKAIILCSILAAVCYYKHYINIVRIIRHEETGLRKTIRKHSKKK